MRLAEAARQPDDDHESIDAFHEAYNDIQIGRVDDFIVKIREISDILYCDRDVMLYRGLGLSETTRIPVLENIADMIFEQFVQVTEKESLFISIMHLSVVDEIFAENFAKKEVFEFMMADDRLFEKYLDHFTSLVPYFEFEVGPLIEKLNNHRIPIFVIGHLSVSLVEHRCPPPEVVRQLLCCVLACDSAEAVYWMIKIGELIIPEARYYGVMEDVGMLERILGAFGVPGLRVKCVNFVAVLATKFPAVKARVISCGFLQHAMEVVDDQEESVAVVGMNALRAMMPEILAELHANEDAFDALWAIIYDGTTCGSVAFREASLRLMHTLVTESAAFRKVFLAHDYLLIQPIMYIGDDEKHMFSDLMRIAYDSDCGEVMKRQIAAIFEGIDDFADDGD